MARPMAYATVPPHLAQCSAAAEGHRLAAWEYTAHDSLVAVTCLEEPIVPGSLRAGSRERIALSKRLQQFTFTTFAGYKVVKYFLKSFCY